MKISQFVTYVIFIEADHQLRTGQLTHRQHQELLKQLHQLFEVQRMKKLHGAGAVSLFTVWCCSLMYLTNLEIPLPAVALRIMKMLQTLF